jgi:hypothetical protein
VADGKITREFFYDMSGGGERRRGRRRKAAGEDGRKPAEGQGEGRSEKTGKRR